ncbi:hypothetical protein [Streptomonospora wellingtoniae]|uniref:DUF2267 domain-containing protein n=1 Tax=Streptomonospora wellingtoniae TaxID=3075544 RepID=A0ABU2KZN9_9ACTN|nr:hypothetical protein [Streptomonospora sp. DSM 45055]MDT0304728.1 hypothetical protein [Streptomonospora sp. DSM 45055]
MPGTDDTDRTKQLAITLVDAYVRKDRDLLDSTLADIGDDTDATVSELKVFGSFLSRRVQETGVVWKPADSREAVASTVADMLPPEVEFAVITVWEAYSVGEEEAAERFTNGDPAIYLHMLAAFSAAIGLAVYKPAELISTLRIATGGEE